MNTGDLNAWFYSFQISNETDYDNGAITMPSLFAYLLRDNQLLHRVEDRNSEAQSFPGSIPFMDWVSLNSIFKAFSFIQ
jgi:hypothetical protein